MHMRTRALVAAGGAAAIVGLAAGPAAAHVSPDKREVPAGAFTDVSLTVGHGCGTSPTTRMEIQIPESIANVTPAVVPGWDVEVTTEPLDEPIEGSHGEQITEREAVVTYTAQPGNELPDGFRLSFTIGFQAPDTPGETLFFKTVQVCAEGETAWIEEWTGEGEEPENPAPAVLVTEGTGGGHGGGDTGDADGEAADGTGTTGAEAGDEGEQAAQPASSEDGDDGGSDGLAIAGLVAGVLGLLAGGAALLRGRRA